MILTSGSEASSAKRAIVDGLQAYFRSLQSSRMISELYAAANFPHDSPEKTQRAADGRYRTSPGHAERT